MSYGDVSSRSCPTWYVGLHLYSLLDSLFVHHFSHVVFLLCWTISFPPSCSCSLQDNCVDQFTPGQKVKLQQAWETYRHKLGYSEQFSLAADGYSCVYPGMPLVSTMSPTLQPTTKSPTLKPTTKRPTSKPTKTPKPTKKKHGTDSVIPVVGMIQFSYHDQHKRTQSIHNSLHVVEFYWVVSNMYCV